MSSLVHLAIGAFAQFPFELVELVDVFSLRRDEEFALDHQFVQDLPQVELLLERVEVFDHLPVVRFLRYAFVKVLFLVILIRQIHVAQFQHIVLGDRQYALLVQMSCMIWGLIMLLVCH